MTRSCSSYKVILKAPKGPYTPAASFAGDLCSITASNDLLIPTPIHIKTNCSFWPRGRNESGCRVIRPEICYVAVARKFCVDRDCNPRPDKQFYMQFPSNVFSPCRTPTHAAPAGRKRQACMDAGLALDYLAFLRDRFSPIEYQWHKMQGLQELLLPTNLCEPQILSILRNLPCYKILMRFQQLMLSKTKQNKNLTVRFCRRVTSLRTATFGARPPMHQCAPLEIVSFTYLGARMYLRTYVATSKLSFLFIEIFSTDRGRHLRQTVQLGCILHIKETQKKNT
ncbi:hypothetical protein RRG08_030933 [Elysia crispata]|uniref:Uncharacterized protein n=1 Tax=Elysia crispata TaxID=231223 RepID=A0AAE1DVE1_9GAST|nr:hypothetical protein RRG08_030933 [Elysia crispata]